MVYDAKVIEVMIASPSDVADERRIVREVLQEWNALHARSLGIVYMPAGWETHSAPDLGGRAQDLINKRVLAHCDLLVGIFWTRVGTPTGTSKSGSIKEIEEHVKLGRPAMLYFSDVPVKLDSVDQYQYDELKEFRSWAKQEGLISIYDSIGVFRDNLRRDLTLILRDNSHLNASVGPKDVFGSPSDDFELVISRDPKPLSEEAREALTVAAGGSDGVVMVLRHLGGTTIQAARRAFVDPKDQRAVARWTAAVEELRDRDLIRDTSGKGEVFRVTDAGYRLAESFG